MAFFYDLFTHWSGTSGSRRSASGPQRYLATGTTTLRRGLPSHCRSPACVVYRPGAAGLWPPRHPHPHPPPLRERSAHRTRIEAGMQDRSNVTSPPPAATKRAMRILRLRKNGSPETRLKPDLGLVSEGHLTGVGRPVRWMCPEGFRIPAVGLSGLGGPHSTCPSSASVPGATRSRGRACCFRRLRASASTPSSRSSGSP